MAKPLTPEELRKKISPSSLPFAKTDELPSKMVPLGQERAVSALSFALEIESHGYNIFLLGPPGAGKHTTAIGVVENYVKDWPVPPDWLYVYNFENEEMPLAISLPAGTGEKLRDGVARLVGRLIEEIPKAFSNEQYARDKADILRKNQEEKNDLFAELEELANGHNFLVQKSSDGITLIYSKDGEPLSPEDFDNLSPDEKETIAKSREILQGKLRETIRAVRETEKNTQALVEELDQKCAMNAVGHELESLFEEFGAYPKVTDYLEALKKDVLEKIDKFRADGREGAPFPLPFLPHSDGVGDTIKRYRVNLLVNNKELSHAPLVIESNPTYHNIVGRIEYRAQYGAFFTDFSAIKAGAFHRANGGALVLNARELLLNPFAYEGMKRILKDQVIRMEEIGEQYRMIATSTLRPEPIAASAKVILMGTPWIFYLLQQYDEDFRKLFKVKGEFAQEMEDTDENRLSYAILVASQCEREGLLPFGADAVAYVIEEGMRLAEHQKKLDTQFLDLCDLVRESGHWAKKAGKKAVDAEDVKKAQKELKFRNDYHEQYIGSMIKDGSILIDVESSEVGQLNGLSVYDMGDYAFGKPSRVTARVFLGKEGVVNIEREAELGGHTHNKGVLILQGFFGARYAQRTPLTFGASICFEQSYGGVDGDSASSTELYALISAITDIPLRQDLAVTGSVNQLGQIQSIGGVNLKIEGFYNTCKMKGLTGKQGVVIPASNAQNLMLDEEVVKAVSERLFHIYTVSTVDEGLEILTGMKAGEPNEFGDYPEGTINAKVVSRLERFANQWKKLQSD